MRYMLLIYADPATQPVTADDKARQYADYGTFTQKIVASGELVGGDELHGIEVATSVRVRDGATSSTDGPFAETKEVLGGYFIVDVVDLDRAIELAAQIPDVATGSVEVRPLVERQMG